MLVDEGPPEADVAGQLRRLGVDEPVDDRSHASSARPRRRRDERAARACTSGSSSTRRSPSESADERGALAEARKRRVRIEVARAGEAFRVGALTPACPLARRHGAARRRSEQPRRRPRRVVRKDGCPVHGRCRIRRHGPPAPAAGRDPQGRPPRLGRPRPRRGAEDASSRASRSSRSAQTTTTATRTRRRWQRSRPPLGSPSTAPTVTAQSSSSPTVARISVHTGR